VGEYSTDTTFHVRFGYARLAVAHLRQLHKYVVKVYRQPTRRPKRRQTKHLQVLVRRGECVGPVKENPPEIVKTKTRDWETGWRNERLEK